MVIFVLFITGCSKSSANTEGYLSSGTLLDTNAKDIMPTLDDLPEYRHMEYRYTHKSFVFESNSVALIVYYDDKTYKSEKEKLGEKYTFLDQKIFDANISKDIIPEHEFSINSYSFKVVAGNGEDNTRFPKSFGMIGTSEENKSIAYLYFNDTDLDYIGEENMANFVKEYFEYDF